jgi:hypothetical protein
MTDRSDTVETWKNGVLIDTRTVTYATTVDQDNALTLRDRAVQALAVNAIYLGRSNPTAAQNAAQVQALTRQVNALIRLLVTRDTSAIPDT